MFSVPNIIVSNNTAFNGNLYPAHVYEWRFSGINCAAEDYTIGGTNTWSVSFKTDIKIDNNADLEVSGYTMKITQNARVNDSKNYYTVEAMPEKAFELDEFLDDAFIEYDQPETLAHLMNRIGWTTSGTGIPYSYVINSKWASQGMTKRQVVGNICQLLGANMVSWMGTVPTLFVLNQTAPTAIPYDTSNVKSVTIADYRAPGINKIWFGTDGTDVGISYGTGAQDQQLTLPYNPLIDPDSQDNNSLLQYIYSKVSGNSYNPVKLTTFLDEAPTFNQLIGAATIPTISFTDENSRTVAFPIFNWEVSPSGCKLEATGNTDRSVSNQNLASEIAQNGKYNKFKRTLDATTSEIANLNGDVSQLWQTANAITTTVAGKVGYDEVISSINQTAETITINASKINLNGAVEVGPNDSQPEAFLTILPSAADLQGQHSQVRLYNNSVEVDTYTVDGVHISGNRMQGAASFLTGYGKVSGVTHSYLDAHLTNQSASNNNAGFGKLYLFPGEFCHASGLTSTYNMATAVITADSDTYDGYGWIGLYQAKSNGTKSGAVTISAQNGAGAISLLGNGSLYAGGTSTYPYAWYQNSHIDMYDSSTKKAHLEPTNLKLENGSNVQASLSPNSLILKASGVTDTVLSGSDLGFYGNNGSGSRARMGHYSGNLLTVGTATPNSVYAELTPAKLIFWNSGQTKVNYVVPEGASVIERGTVTKSGNTWTYRKWSDNTYECWLAKHYNTTTNHTFGNQYYTEIAAIDYPVTFAAAPHENVSVEGGTVTSSQNVSVYLSNNSPGTSTTKSGAYLAMRPTNSTVDFWIDYYVKGTVSS